MCGIYYIGKNWRNGCEKELYQKQIHPCFRYVEHSACYHIIIIRFFMFVNKKMPQNVAFQRVDKVDTLTDKRKWTQTRNHEADSTMVWQ